ncbi:hypothetical protein B0H12DRAFT_1171096 [Mycena haematopus]|nr:hypothetical protein B0H12DRAFT_1171096 [Mycena haematopus]
MDSNSNRQGKWPLFQDQGHRRTPSLPNPTGTPQPQTTASTAPSTLSLNSPGNPLAPGKQRKQFQGGYEKSPKIPSYQPFSLNNPGTPRRKAFNLSSTTSNPLVNNSVRRFFKENLGKVSFMNARIATVLSVAEVLVARLLLP